MNMSWKLIFLCNLPVLYRQRCLRGRHRHVNCSRSGRDGLNVDAGVVRMNCGDKNESKRTSTNKKKKKKKAIFQKHIFSTTVITSNQTGDIVPNSSNLTGNRILGKIQRRSYRGPASNIRVVERWDVGWHWCSSGGGWVHVVLVGQVSVVKMVLLMGSSGGVNGVVVNGGGGWNGGCSGCGVRGMRVGVEVRGRVVEVKLNMRRKQ